MSNISISKVSSWFGGIILIITVFYIILFDPSKYNPDYGSYKLLYEIIINQDFKIYFSKFALLDYFVRLLDFTGNYDDFRLSFASVELLLFVFILRGLKITWKKLNIFISFFLSAFLLLKVHVQIREGLALLLWLFSLNSISKEKYFTLKNKLFFLISTFLHSSTIFYWISTFVLKNDNFSAKKKRVFVISLFSLLGTSTWGLFNNIDNFSYYNTLGYEAIEINFSKILYWISFFIIYFLILRNENLKITAINEKIIQKTNSSFIANIGFYGFLGFAPAAALCFLGSPPNEVTFNLIYRIFLNLLFLICFYRSSTQPNNFYTNLSNSFIFIIVFELLIT